ncbi:molybdenum cofactor guanylyltransferase [Actinomadura miaoliensis]|uniref:MobA-like NTP transferase domain-containing protein n=1 Tax=Actinomadura miaoliensis TaxID=430685 RepID=A0ABP7VKI7_9ACTN
MTQAFDAAFGTAFDEVFDAVVLAGGRARRMDGADKPGLPVGGRTLVARVAEAVRDARHLIVVGPPRAELPHATVVREDPPGAGPVPALRAGLAEVRAPWLALLAADLPFLRPGHVAALLDAARRGRGGGAVLVDAEGREQWLAGCWRTAGLRAALAGYEGASLRGVLGPLTPVRVSLGPAGAAGERPPWYDCDTPGALAHARRLLTEGEE